jgi:CheY-like chemotaxis protein
MKKSDFTILVADDDPDYLFQIVFNIEKAGYKTIAVESKPDAGTKFTVRLPKKQINIT